MDLNRVLRAKTAQRMEMVEARRGLFLTGKLDADRIDAGEWELITAMDGIEANG